MKRVLISMLCIVVMMCFMPTMAFADGGSGSAPQTGNAETTVAKIGDTEYATLAEAVAAVHQKTGEDRNKTYTIELQSNASGGGIPVGYNSIKDATTTGENPVNIVIDLKGHTYTVTTPTVGSAGTETNGFQMLKGSNVTFKDGKISTELSGGILLQNYCNLTLDNVSVNAPNEAYVMSNNFGNVVIKNETNITAGNNKVAFDLWYGLNSEGLYDDGVTVTFDESFTGTVKGKIEYGAQSQGAIRHSDWKTKTVLNINGNGKFEGTFASSSENALEGASIAITGGTFTSDPSGHVAEGYTVSGDTAPYTVVEESAKGSVILAPLVDRSENPVTGLDKDYEILYDGNTVTINVKPQLHANGENNIGKWVGIAVPVPDGATTVDYHYSDRSAVSNASLNGEIWPKGDKNYMSFYWDYAARNVEWIKYKFNEESKFHKVNIAVNAAPTTVTEAPLHDNAATNPIADNALYSKYDIAYVDDTATITVKGLKEHYNGQDPAVKGKWVGIAVPADCKDSDTQLFYKYDDGEWKNAALSEEKWNNTKDGKPYVSFYMNAATVKARTISYAFGTLADNGEIPTTVTGVNTVKVNVVEESEYTGGGAAVVPPATDNVTNNPADKKTTADLTPAVKDNKAETTVDAKTADKIVDKAVENKSTEVVIDAAGNNNVASSEVAIPEKTVKELAEKTDANLVIKTDNGKVDLDKTALEAVAAQAGTDGTVKLVVETVKSDENICHVDLKLVTSNGAVTDFRGGIVTVTITLSKELAAKDVVCVYINDNGIYTLVNGQKNADGTYTFTTGHFSEYAVMAKDEADKKIAEQLDTMIKEVNLKVRTSKTSKKNIKAVVSGDVKAITDAGYTVKYKFYRSEKKASKYVGKVTKTSKTYINTVGKKGTKYYYKAKALVYDGDKLVGQTVLTQCKYGVRTWSK